MEGLATGGLNVPATVGRIHFNSDIETSNFFVIPILLPQAGT